jgi:hypothetical protein
MQGVAYNKTYTLIINESRRSFSFNKNSAVSLAKASLSVRIAR